VGYFGQFSRAYADYEALVKDCHCAGFRGEIGDWRRSIDTLGSVDDHSTIRKSLP